MGATEGGRRVVAVLTDVAALSKPFDYLVPSNFSGPLEIGSRVRVPLHGRSVRGWIVGPGLEGLAEVKPIKSSLGVGPTEEILDLARWASWRWNGPWARFLTAASSETIVRSLPQPPTFVPFDLPSSDLGLQGISGAESNEGMSLEIGPATDPFDAVLGFIGRTLGSVHPEQRSVVVLVPGRGYARRLVGRLARRGIPAVDAGEDWAAARAGWPVVVGTRAGAFAPVQHLGGMIVLDGDDERFYSESSPTWNVVDVARQRCQGLVPLLVVASCPSAVITHHIEPRSLSRVQVAAGWPQVEFVDLRQQDPRTGILSEKLVALGRAALSDRPTGVALACIVNRKGRARLVVCSRCDNVARCASCDAACALDVTLDCPRCGSSRPVICTTCGATAMKLLRLGTTQLAADCAALFGEKAVEITASSVPNAQGQARIVVGTEAILHRVRSAGVVAFLDLDHHLLAPRAGAEQAALSLLGKAGRLVGGRAETEHGVVLVQTRLRDHLVLHAAVNGDPTAVLESDTAMRRQLGLAPFGAVAHLKGDGAQAFAEALVKSGLTISVLGKGEVLVQASDTAILCDALSKVPRPKEKLRVGVDPASF